MATPSLSIIVPFFNARNNSARLLSTLAELRVPFVELIFVDDGSTDGTVAMLQGFAAKSPLPVVVIEQANGGPGKARNAGLRRARGDYVWFVDCDDDIRIAAIEQFERLQAEQFDFIDFDADGIVPGNTMGLDAGPHQVSAQMRVSLIGGYGAIWTKITRRDLLVENDIWYPESCIFEDNALSSVLPFYVERFFRSDSVGYVHHLDFESVTRQKLSPRYFDRLHTAAWGLDTGKRLAARSEEIAALEQRFSDLFLVNTTMQIFGMLYPDTGFFGSLRSRRYAEAASKFVKHMASLWWARSWMISARVHRYYREVAKLFGVSGDPLGKVRTLDNQGLRRLRGIWVTSYLLGSQRKHFERLRMQAWSLESPGPIWTQPRSS